MILVKYNPDSGHVLPDNQVEQFVFDVIEKSKQTNYNLVTVGSSLFVDVFRVMVTRGVISHEDLKFEFKDQHMIVDKLGNLDHWPRGFCNHTENALMEILGWEVDNYKTKC